MKRRSSVTLLIAAALLLAPLSACTALPSGSGSSGAASAGSPDRGRDAAGSEAAAESIAPSEPPGAKRSVISTGDISIEVSDPESAADEASGIAKNLGGSVESMTVRRASGGAAAGADLTLRVPNERLEDAFKELEGIGEVVSQNSSAVDVTAEYVDLRARVAALEKSVQRLTGLMAGADTTADLLEAESALSQRQQELDGLRAQLQSLEGQVDEATIAVSLRTKSALPGGGPANFWEGLLAGLDSLAAAGAGALVALGILLPWLVLAGVIALAVVLIVRGGRRRRRARAASGSPDPAAAPATAAAADTAPQYPPTPPSSAP